MDYLVLGRFCGEVMCVEYKMEIVCGCNGEGSGWTSWCCGEILCGTCKVGIVWGIKARVYIVGQPG